jgi:hypothetical protein
MDPSLLMQFLPMLQNLLGGGGQQSQGGFGSQNAGTLGLGALQAVPSLINLVKLSREERPNYKVGNEMQSAYDTSFQRSKMGFTPAQTGAFRQNIAQAQNTDYYNARNMAGGNLAQAISGGLTGRRLGAYNNFAAQDAAQQNQNLNTWYGQAGRMQGQQNMATQQDIAYRMAKENAAGAGLSSGLTNIASGINANQALGLGNRTGLGGFGGTVPEVNNTDQGMNPAYGPGNLQYNPWQSQYFGGPYAPGGAPVKPKSMLSTGF